MNLLTLSVFFVSVCCISCQDVFNTNRPTSSLFNERLDEIIAQTLEKHKDEISPLELANQTVSFHRMIGRLVLTGEVGFTNNYLHGLSTIRRIHDAFLSKTEDQDARLILQLETKNLSMSSDAHALFMGIGPRILTQLNMRHAHGKAILLFKHRTEEVIVESFEVEELLGLRLQILKAPGFVTPFVAKQIVNGALAVFNPLIRSAVTRAGHTLLDNMVKENELVKDIMAEAYGL